MRKVVLAAGGPNYETVLHDVDAHWQKEQDSSSGTGTGIIPSERCGGDARQANLKRKARYISRSVAETFAYCTQNTVSIENAAEILQTFTNVRICFYCIGV